jgi:hypothetical protein
MMPNQYNDGPPIIIQNTNVQKGCGSGCGTGCLVMIAGFIFLAIIGAIIHNLSIVLLVLIVAAGIGAAVWLFLTPDGKEQQGRIKSYIRGSNRSA